MTPTATRSRVPTLTPLARGDSVTDISSFYTETLEAITREPSTGVSDISIIISI